MEWKSLIRPKTENSHKYDYGHVLIYGGQMAGAASLASVSALRMGAGLVTVAVSRETTQLYTGLSTSVILEERTDFRESLQDKRRNVILIGPGAGNCGEAVRQSLETGKICVLDADALRPEILEFTHSGCVLTPHEGEFERLFPDIKGEKSLRAIEAARRSRAIIVLKGHETVIARPDGYLETLNNGSPWLATAGSGDVLAGMIAGFAAWHDNPLFEATCAAVWMHGEASQLAGPGMISADLPDMIPDVWVRELSSFSRL